MVSADRPLPSFVSIGSYMPLSDRMRLSIERLISRWSGPSSALPLRIMAEKAIARLPVEQGGLGVNDRE